MALAHARRLTLDGIEYAWTASIPSTTLDCQAEHMTIAVQRSSGGRKLIAYAAAFVDGHARAITPGAIREIIEIALGLGWASNERGGEFILGVEAHQSELRAPRNATLRARVIVEELRTSGQGPARSDLF